MSLDLAAIRLRMSYATPGPWYFQPMQGDGAPEGLTAITDGGIGVVGSTLNPSDGEFVAHAREDVSALLDEVALGRRILDAVNVWLDQNAAEITVPGMKSLGAILGEIQP